MTAEHRLSVNPEMSDEEFLTQIQPTAFRHQPVIIQDPFLPNLVRPTRLDIHNFTIDIWTPCCRTTPVRSLNRHGTMRDTGSINLRDS